MSQHVAVAIHEPAFGAPVHRVSAASSNHSWSLPAGAVGAVWRARRERTAVTRFAAEIEALGLGGEVPEAARRRILAAVAAVARRVDAGRSVPNAFGYGRRVLHQDPAGSWTLATVTFRPGQATTPHDHDGWGCAVVLRGVERERRYALVSGNRLVLREERDVAPGEGYAFDPEEIHQPVGVAPDRVTVSLHFLHHGRRDRPQRYRETTATSR